MAVVAANKNGTEVIADNLVRGYHTKRGSLILEGGKFYQGRDTETIARNEIAAHQTLKNYIDQI